MGTNLVAAGLLHTEGLTREKLRDAFRKAEFSTELDDIETTFADELQDSIADVDSKRDTGELTGVVERWDPIVHELYGLEEASEADGIDRILFESKEEAIEEVAAAIARAAGFNLVDTAGLEVDLKAAVARAYRDAIGSFVEQVGDTVAEQFLVASGIELHSQLHETQCTLDDLYERFSRRRYDFLPGIEVGRERVIERLSRELSGPTDTKVEYVPRPELEDYEGDESLLLLGPGGSGKTRSLVELVRTHEDVAHIVHPREAFQNPSDVDRFVMERFEGDVLLVWDDIHEANPEEENAVIRKAIVELRDLLTPKFELRVLATGRIEQEEPIPGDPDDEDGLWRGIESVELAGLSPEVLAQVIGAAIDAYDVAVSEDTVEAFYKKAWQAEPTPLYVVSVLQNARDELTDADIKELPKSALEIWEKNYAELDENSKRVLRSMKVLGDLAPGGMFPKSLLRGMYVEVIPGSEGEFQSSLDTVVDQYWLVENETENGNVYGMHDVKREAVTQQFERWLIEDLSDFLLTSSERYCSTVSFSTSRTLHSNLARRIKEYDWSRDLAAEHCEYVLERTDENDAVAHLHYGIVLGQKGDTELAKRQYDQAIEIDPNLAVAYHNYGFLLQKEGDVEPAKKYYQRATEIDSRYAESYTNYGVLLQQEGDIKSAKDCYEQAIESEPEDAEPYANYGILLLENSQSSLAVKQLESSVQLWLSKDNFENALNDMRELTEANSESGNQARAIETCVAALRLASTIDIANEAVDWAWEFLSEVVVSESETTVRLGLITVVKEDFGIGYNLLQQIWERKDVDDHLGRVTGVAIAAFHTLSDVNGDDPDKIVADIDPKALCAPVRAVYDFLADGGTDRAVDEEPSVPDFVLYPVEADDDGWRIGDIPFDILEAAAFDTLLLRLRSETGPDNE